MYELEHRLARQCAVSRVTFGPHERRAGVMDHIRKELDEINNATKQSEVVKEWTDVAILAWDGLMRASREYLRQAYDEEPTNTAVVDFAINHYLEKLDKNELRDWPDWRTADPNKAIEHVRGTHD